MGTDRGPANHCGAAGPLTSRMEALAPIRRTGGAAQPPEAPSPLTLAAASARTLRSGDPPPRPGRGAMPPGPRLPPPRAPGPREGGRQLCGDAPLGEGAPGREDPRSQCLAARTLICAPAGGAA